METEEAIQGAGMGLLFKSYYVVWKRAHTLPFFLRIFPFKSYYVVWKPRDHQSLRCACIEFKSYYVVWKHLQYNTMFSPVKTFKSYYVVWKLAAVIAPIANGFCLNRTM